MKPGILILCLVILGFSCSTVPKEVSLFKGMTINETIQIKPATYQLSGADSLSPAIITIEGNDLLLDFKGTTIDGARNGQKPNKFSGVGLLIQNSQKVTIKNLTLKGYKVALMAKNVDSLALIGCDFSYNYRQRLLSKWEKENLTDWLSYQQNETDEWLRHGAAIYLKNCDHALVKSIKANNGQNGLMLDSCHHGLFYNNQIQFNSGVGIGLYQSGNNRIMHNKLDWNVRSYSHGFYQSGQGSASILCYKQSNNNLFAYNSATHSDNGFFQRADLTTRDSTERGWNDILLYGNDFSHAPNQGAEVIFSSTRETDIPEPLQDGMDAMLPKNHPQGLSFILVNEWGPYNFDYPSVWLREIQADGTYVFLLMGPEGNWKVTDGNGFNSINPKTGSFPVTLTAKKEPKVKDLALKFEFVGQAFTDQFGREIPKGKIYQFNFERQE